MSLHKAYSALKGVQSAGPQIVQQAATALPNAVNQLSNLNNKNPEDSYSEKAKTKRLTPAERKALYEKIIRVDHAGEFGANEIYRGQLRFMKDEKDKELIQHMWDQEKAHLAKFRDEFIPKHNARPTALLPVWRIAGYTLGASTAFMSKNAAMACTAAVEDSIVKHYNDQLRLLLEDLEKIEEKCPEHLELMESIKKFRDEEQEHHDIGIEHGAEKTMNYKLVYGIIQAGCSAAIAVTEKI